jgi:hypothetical protein
MALLGGISYFQVSKQLQNQSRERLEKEVKAHGLAIFERLNFLESELSIIGLARAHHIQEEPEGARSSGAARFKGVCILNNRGEVIPVQGAVPMDRLKPTALEEGHMGQGNTVLRVLEASEEGPRIWMLQALPDAKPQAGYLIGEIAPEYLWGENTGNGVSPLTDIFILGPSKGLLFSSVDQPNPFLRFWLFLSPPFLWSCG